MSSRVPDEIGEMVNGLLKLFLFVFCPAVAYKQAGDMSERND